MNYCINRFILVFLLIVPFNNNANASGWDAFVNCFTDLCNCGVSDKEKYEKWGQQSMYKGKRNRMCPPWNKEGGRDDHICLAGQNYPSNFSIYFQKLCAESTPDSNFFEPKIRIRDQTCNAFACWTTVNEIKWDGKCKTLAGPYGLPLTRMCARIAIPGDPRKDIPPDPGYTFQKHLTYEGVTEKDETPLGSDGQPIVINLPKLCAYLDPAFMGSWDEGFELDLMDLDPNSQPMHRTRELHPVVKVIIFIIDIGTSILGGGPALLGKTLDNFAGSGGGFTSGGQKGIGSFEFLSGIYNFAYIIFKILGMILIELLKEFGQMNRVVNGTVYGCVNIPLAPYPPPFCPKIAPLFEEAATQNICAIDADGLLATSTDNSPCVVSTLKNNFIHNSIRVGFDNFMPLCRKGENPMETDKCIGIENLDLFSSASAMHLLTTKLDIIKPCANAASGDLCVKSKIPYTCSVSDNGCNQGYRIVYSSNVQGVADAEKHSTPSNYFHDDMPDCPSTESLKCQKIWGVNFGEFIDIPLIFPSIQTSSDITDISKSFTLTSKNQVVSTFSASIVRKNILKEEFEFTQEPKDICVFDANINSVIGCEKRAPSTNPKVYNCDSNINGITCNTDYFKPTFIASVSSGTETISAKVEPLTIYDSSNTTNSNVVNLAGYDFDSFVTDDTFVQIPFKGDKVLLNAATLAGNYIGDEKPVNIDGSKNQGAIYIDGLEYINSEYARGGKYACLEQRTNDRCPTNTTLCVLTKLANANVVDCSIFLNKSTIYPGLHKCGDDVADYTSLKEHLPGLSGGPGIDIKTNGVLTCYISTIELCVITNDPDDRIIPSASYGNNIPISQYYDINAVADDSLNYTDNTTNYYSDKLDKVNTADNKNFYGLDKLNYNYNKSLYGLRNKTPLEMSLCTSIPQPACAAVTSGALDKASWTSAAIGEFSNGTCSVGTHAVKPMQRYCLINSDAKTVELQDLGAGPECAPGP